MTTDELLPKIAAGHWTLWYRKRCKPSHWHISNYGEHQACIEACERMLRKRPGRCAVILPPGETPLGAVDVPYEEHGGE